MLYLYRKEVHVKGSFLRSIAEGVVLLALGLILWLWGAGEEEVEEGWDQE